MWRDHDRMGNNLVCWEWPYCNLLFHSHKRSFLTHSCDYSYNSCCSVIKRCCPTVMYGLVQRYGIHLESQGIMELQESRTNKDGRYHIVFMIVLWRIANVNGRNYCNKALHICPLSRWQMYRWWSPFSHPEHSLKVYQSVRWHQKITWSKSTKKSVLWNSGITKVGWPSKNSIFRILYYKFRLFLCQLNSCVILSSLQQSIKDLWAFKQIF